MTYSLAILISLAIVEQEKLSCRMNREGCCSMGMPEEMCRENWDNDFMNVMYDDKWFLHYSWALHEHIVLDRIRDSRASNKSNPYDLGIFNIP